MNGVPKVLRERCELAVLAFGAAGDLLHLPECFRRPMVWALTVLSIRKAGDCDYR